MPLFQKTFVHNFIDVFFNYSAISHEPIKIFNILVLFYSIFFFELK